LFPAGDIPRSGDLLLRSIAMSVQETATPPKRRRKVELPQLPLKQQKHIFGGDIPRLAAEEGRKSPGKGTIQKLTSRAGREAGLSPKVTGWIGKRPVYAPADVLTWLDSLVTPEPRTAGMTLITAPAPVATTSTEQHIATESVAQA
jgi:hypothetical protein